MACWLIRRVSRSLSGREDVPNPDVPNALVNHMSERISSRFVRGRQVPALPNALLTNRGAAAYAPGSWQWSLRRISRAMILCA